MVDNTRDRGSSDSSRSAPAAVPRRNDVLLVAGFLSSGVAALGLELIWVRILGLVFGSESFGVLGVLVGFFAGLTIGATVIHRLVLRSRRPLRIYIALEIAIAAYALVASTLMLRLVDTLPRYMGPFVGDNRSPIALALNLLVAMVLLLPATACMGATTVAIVEAWRRGRTRAENENTVAWLYGANTLGATLGVLLCTYGLLPALGVQSGSGALAAFSLLAAALAWRWERAQTGSNAADTTDARKRAAELRQPARVASGGATVGGYSRWRLYALLFCTGLAGIGLETVGTHVLAQIYENTVHTFANILAVFLLGTSIGAWLYTTPSVRRLLGDRDRATVVLLYGLAISGVVAAAIVAHAAAAMAVLAPAGSSYVSRMVAEALFAALVFLPPTVLMGATFSHLVGHFTYDGVGYATALNTLGASLAPFLFGLLLVPYAGYGIAFYGAVALYLLLFVAAGATRARTPLWVLGGFGAAVVVGALTFTSLVLVQFPANAHLLAQRVGVLGVVSVTDQPAPGRDPASAPRVLQVDQKHLMGGSPGFVTQRMGHLPMLVAQNTRRALFLGVGTGITAGAALDYPVERVTAVELVPEILDMLPWFDSFNHSLRADRRVALQASDARRFVVATDETYNVIVADLYHPSRDGTGSLYTEEHYRNIRGRLEDGGIFVQWLPLHQLRPHDLKTIIRTFLSVFPDAHSMIGNYSGSARFALLGWKKETGPTGVDVPRAEAFLRRRAQDDPVFDGVRDLLASYMLDSEALKRFSGPGPLNTDGNQRITIDAAGAARIEDGADTRQSLATLLPYRRPFPDDFVRVAGPAGLAALRHDVQPYADSVTHYLAAEVARLEAPPGTLPAGVLAQYLKAYETDVEFTLSVGKLLELAVEHPATAKEIVERLWVLHPDQPNISRLRHRLSGINATDEVRAMVSRFVQTGGD